MRFVRIRWHSVHANLSIVILKIGIIQSCMLFIAKIHRRSSIPLHCLNIFLLILGITLYMKDMIAFSHSRDQLCLTEKTYGFTRVEVIGTGCFAEPFLISGLASADSYFVPARIEKGAKDHFICVPDDHHLTNPELGASYGNSKVAHVHVRKSYSELPVLPSQCRSIR